MASRTVVPHQPLGGEMKQKNIGPADARNRRVLQDIGNLVKDRAVRVKKPVVQSVDPAIVGDVVGPRRVPAVVSRAAAAAAKKATEKPEPETVIVISSDDESDTSKAVDRRVSMQGPSKKGGKAFTSILTARSKAASGLASKPKDAVLDIDAADADNELAVVEYVDDMYKFYKLAEVDSRVQGYMHLQLDINSRMRAILVDWLIEVHRKFELMPETLYLTINIIDRFLAVKVVPRRELQLVGMSAMLIASKYEEIWAPEVKDFVSISDNAYMREQVLAMEKAILGKLEWYLTVPTLYVFLVRYIKASLPCDKEMENMTFFLAELGLLQYQIAITYSPSVIAASAVYAARCTLDKSPFWTETLQHHTGYTEDMIKNCGKLLIDANSAAAESKLKAVYKKFSSPDRGAVALLSPARGLAA
ncbi:hypothetical protein Tsubulata_008865 [Turnera subulata]|uniref:B-like cyclin n=1 Tax=Turnera subulata TaxID=218843 RepID=A0A9Q0F363_9ROSI|nr:hypothetical protein Tsubulata_008865 [Turnera subulata]